MVVAPIQTGFRLETLGTAEQAGRRFLETTVASIDANREATLLSAKSRYCVAACQSVWLWCDVRFSHSSTKASPPNSHAKPPHTHTAVFVVPA